MKTKIQINSTFGKLLFEFEKENNSIRSTLIEAAKINADLGGADLSGANLSGANLSERYIQIACIGSENRMTTYRFVDDTIWCGCFKGTLEEFENRVKETHKNNPQYFREYLGFIAYIRGVR